MSDLTHCLIFCPLAIDPKARAIMDSFDPETACRIAVDGGVSHLEKLKLEPHAWIGDGDSLKSAAQLKKLKCQKIKLGANKDYSDLEGALHVAAQAMFKHAWSGDIAIFGAQGGRFDHDLANMLSARKWLEDVSAIAGTRHCPTIYSFGANGIWAASVDELEFSRGRGEPFSVFTFDRKTKVRIQGAKFNLAGKALSCASHGLSNEGTGKTVRVRASGGPVLVVIPAL